MHKAINVLREVKIPLACVILHILVLFFQFNYILIVKQKVYLGSKKEKNMKNV